MCKILQNLPVDLMRYPEVVLLTHKRDWLHGSVHGSVHGFAQPRPYDGAEWTVEVPASLYCIAHYLNSLKYRGLFASTVVSHLQGLWVSFSLFVCGIGLFTPT